MNIFKTLQVVNAGLLILLFTIFGRAVEDSQKELTIIPERVTEIIKVDGNFTEEIWSKSPVSGEFLTFSPVYGETLGQRTAVWMAYNDKNLYFALKCYDSEPDGIKTSISKRDNIVTDDWIGVIIDTMGNHQSSCEFYVNPNGIQEDGIASAVTKGNVDISPDFVWESAGKITGDGYQIEISIPLESIRFKGGSEVKMGIMFMRNINRLGKMGSWPEIKVGQTQFNHMAKVIYKNLTKGLNLEILPNFTYNMTRERQNNPDWQDSDISKNIGASLKYGITSSITTEATFNPDFSQVESDAFQVEVNQRYPIFYSEKRPFFMEGMNAFDFGLVSMGMMTSAVHTRQIIDPGWSAKISGTSGKMLYAVLVANDEAPGHPWEKNQNPYEGKDAFWGIARMKYNIGRDNSIGILYSGRFFAGGSNNVLGADFQYRFLKYARLNLSYLNSRTREPGETGMNDGYGINAMVEYETRAFYSRVTYERYDDDFTMYSAFLMRNNLSRSQFLFAKSVYPKTKGTASWIQKIDPYIVYTKLHDFATGLDDTDWGLGIRIYFTKSGYVRIIYHDTEEAWQGELFKLKYVNTLARVQLFKWLYVQGSYQLGDKIYYHPEEPFLGYGPTWGLELSLQPNIKSHFLFEWLQNTLYHKMDNHRVYTVDIYNLLASYQFNRYFFIRGALRFNNLQKKLLTDFLASFTLIPGTVMHLGYGSIYEQKEWRDNQWIYGHGDMLNVKNGFYFKISYLWRIR